jgi:putative adhesin
VDVAEGELQVSYGRDGEVSIAALAKSSAQAGIPDSFLPALLSIEQSGNHITIHASEPPPHQERISILYRIDVPYRTKLTSKINSGKHVITGILGPVDAVTNKGEIKAAYISSELKARVGTGNLDLQVIGGHVDAVAGSGNISGMRLPQGISAETGEGDITLMVVGPSTAIVKKGTGRIEVGGARDTLAGSTDRGDLHVKAIPHQDWQLSSASGDVRVELPPSAKFELEASTNTGELQFDWDDIIRPDANALQLHQAINGGGKRIAVHTESGRISIR